MNPIPDNAHVYLAEPQSKNGRLPFLYYTANKPPDEILSAAAVACLSRFKDSLPMDAAARKITENAINNPMAVRFIGTWPLSKAVTDKLSKKNLTINVCAHGLFCIADSSDGPICTLPEEHTGPSL